MAFTVSGRQTAVIAFDDLTGYDWAQDAIGMLAAQGVINGIAAKTFDPAGPLTRGQFAALLQRFFRLPQPSQPVAFSDVQPGDWDYAAVQAAAPYMAAGGGGALFQPDQPAEGQAVAAAVAREFAAQGKLAVLSDSDAQAVLATVPDAVSVSPAHEVYVATAIKDRFMVGNPDGSFKPGETLTRAEAAVLLSRLEGYR